MSRIEIECLKQLPLTAEEIDAIWRARTAFSFAIEKLVNRLCLSHERLRAELSGAEIIIKEMEQTCPEKL